MGFLLWNVLVHDTKGEPVILFAAHSRDRDHFHYKSWWGFLCSPGSVLGPLDLLRQSPFHAGIVQHPGQGSEETCAEEMPTRWRYCPGPSSCPQNPGGEGEVPGATLGKEAGRGVSLESAVFVGCGESGVCNSVTTGGRSLKNKSQTLPH